MTNIFRGRLLASSLLVGIALVASGAAQAQDAGQISTPNGAAPAADQDATANGGDIVVTGTLVRNPNLVQSSPINSVTSEELQLRQTNVAEQFLR